MERFHEEEARRLFEELVDRGWVNITWARVYRWFGVSKLHKRAYRELLRTIKDAAKAKGGTMPQVGIISNGSGYGSELLLVLQDRVDNFNSWGGEGTTEADE